MIRACGCTDDAALKQLVQEIKTAYDEESLLFREA
jgi:hypothetical protein